MNVKEYFEQFNSEEHFDSFLKYLLDNNLIREKLSKERVYTLINKLFTYLVDNNIYEFRMDDYYDSYENKVWILEEELEDYCDAFDLIEEYMIGYERPLELFVLNDWEYRIMFNGEQFVCERICGQGEVLRRIGRKVKEYDEDLGIGNAWTKADTNRIAREDRRVESLMDRARKI